VLDNDINPVSARFVEDSVSRAEDAGAAALVLLLDTPGGLSTSMDDIIQAELESRVPVIVYVSPDGARAASAGAFVTMASDLAAMAPNTNIGSATPVSSAGGDISGALGRKVRNDARAKIRALATTHGRNAEAAERTVTKASNYTAQEALDAGLVEEVAPDLATLLDRVDGTVTPYKDIRLETAGAHVERFEMPLTQRLLDILIDPNLLFILFLAGLAGLAYELVHPGAILPGTIGAVCLLLALVGFSTVPINYAGIALIGLGVALVVTEAFVASGGALGAGGAIALAVGGLLLFRTDAGGPGVSPYLAIGLGLSFGAGLAFVATKVIAARHQPVSPYGSGGDGLLGQTAVARTPLVPRGQVFVHGELWQAETDGAEVAAGRRVVVNRIEGLTLRVSPAPEPNGKGVAS
jgi:membrane-bound serine protease (ClpP class)